MHIISASFSEHLIAMIFINRLIMKLYYINCNFYIIYYYYYYYYIIVIIAADHKEQ